jgi:hypothetical protein
MLDGMICERLHGGSIRDCGCRLHPHDRENGGGWLNCPPEARRVLPKYSRQAERVGRLTGDICHSCGGASMVRTGTCLTCQDCGDSSGGCS